MLLTYLPCESNDPTPASLNRQPACHLPACLQLETCVRFFTC